MWTADTQCAAILTLLCPQAVAASLSSELANGTVEAQQACFRPLTPDGLPVIGAIPGSPGAFVASGHSCWCAFVLSPQLLVQSEATVHASLGLCT